MVSGIVQGVGFRPFVYRTAVKNGLVGYVRNRGDAVVEIVVEGNKDSINQFLKDLQNREAFFGANLQHHNRHKKRGRGLQRIQDNKKLRRSQTLRLCYSARRFDLR